LLKAREAEPEIEAGESREDAEFEDLEFEDDEEDLE
jgi:hypothetical protein